MPAIDEVRSERRMAYANSNHGISTGYAKDGVFQNTTPLVLAQSQDPVREAEWRVGFHVAVAQPHVAPHNQVALMLAPRLFRVTFVEAVCAHGRSGAERVHVRRARKLGICVAKWACHDGARVVG
jgi:hypothetical protein